MKRMIFTCLIIAAASMASFGQSLPVGKWKLIAYNFAGKIEHPIEGIDITLNIHDNGKLGGKSGCNVYGGEYTIEKGKLAISGIISTMMACEEPTPQFEHDFYGVLNSATEFKVKRRELTLTDRATHKFLRFVDAKDDK